MDGGVSSGQVASAATLEALDTLYGAALPHKELRKELAPLFASRAWEVLEELVEGPMARAVVDAETLAAHRAQTLELLKARRHLVGGKDRYALEASFAGIFSRAAKRHLVERAADAVPCRGRDCGFSFAPGTRFVSCPVCQYRGCVECGSASEHASCAEYAATLVELQAAGVEMHPCPNCSTMVSKDGGCDRMRCESCLRQWDWTSGKTGKDLSVEHVWVKPSK